MNKQPSDGQFAVASRCCIVTQQQIRRMQEQHNEARDHLCWLLYQMWGEQYGEIAEEYRKRTMEEITPEEAEQCVKRFDASAQ